MRSLIGAALFALSTVALVHQGRADPLPTVIGACSETVITDIGYRLGTPDSGSAISTPMAASRSPTIRFRKSTARESATR